MFEVIGNTVRNIISDLESAKTEKEFKEFQKHHDAFDKEWRRRCGEINALDPDTTEPRQWVCDNREVPDVLYKKIDDYIAGDHVRMARGIEYAKALVGARMSLAAVRSKITEDRRGFGLWDKEDRIVETSVLFFLGEDKYENYDDISDDEVPDIKEYLDFDNPHNAIISNEMIEEAFMKVQGENPMYFVQVDIKADIIRMIPVSHIRLNNSDGSASELFHAVDKNDPNIIDLEVVNGKACPIHEGEDAQGLGAVKFFRNDGPTVNVEDPENAQQEDQQLFRSVVDRIEKFIIDSGLGSVHRLYRVSNDSGLYELLFDNFSSIAVDPGIIAGNGVNFLSTARVIYGGVSKYITALVNLEQDPDIAKKILQQPEYVLTQKEHERALSRLYPKMAIYDFVDFSGMSDYMTKMTQRDKVLLGKKLGVIVDLMIKGDAIPARFRFLTFESVEKFILISDDKVKAPLQSMVRTILPWSFVVNGEELTYNTLNAGKPGNVIESYTIEYGA